MLDDRALVALDAAALCATHGVTAREERVEGHPVTIFEPAGELAARVVFLHGGGLVAGNRYDGVDTLLRHAGTLGLEVWSVEYPLAPQSTLGEMARVALATIRAARDRRPLLLAGQSAGGAVAATAALRSRGSASTADGLMLICPMLARADELSARQFADDPSWSARSNETAWSAALGPDDAPPAESPDLTGLPAVYLDSGSAELFRSAILSFADRACRAGVATELHVWSGAFHASDCVDESAALSSQSHDARRDWIERWLRDEL